MSLLGDKPIKVHTNPVYDDDDDFQGYDDKFPTDSQAILKLLAVTIPLTSGCISVAFFMGLFTS